MYDDRKCSWWQVAICELIVLQGDHNGTVAFCIVMWLWRAGTRHQVKRKDILLFILQVAFWDSPADGASLGVSKNTTKITACQALCCVFSFSPPYDLWDSTFPPVLQMRKLRLRRIVFQAHSFVRARTWTQGLGIRGVSEGVPGEWAGKWPGALGLGEQPLPGHVGYLLRDKLHTESCIKSCDRRWWW